jgi:hypothetical protein
LFEAAARELFVVVAFAESLAASVNGELVFSVAVGDGTFRVTLLLFVVAAFAESLAASVNGELVFSVAVGDGTFRVTLLLFVVVAFAESLAASVNGELVFSVAVGDGTFRVILLLCFFVETLALDGDSLGVFTAFSFFDGRGLAIEVLFERGAPRMAGEEPGPLVGICKMIGLFDSSSSDPTRYSESAGTGCIVFVFRVVLLLCFFVATLALEGDFLFEGFLEIFSFFDGVAETGEAVKACSDSKGCIVFVFRVVLLLCFFVATLALEGDFLCEGFLEIFSFFNGDAETGEAMEASFGRGASGITGSWKEGPFPFVGIGLLG